MKKYTSEEIEAFRDLNATQVAHSVLGRWNSLIMFPLILREGQKLFHDMHEHILPREGIVGVMEKLLEERELLVLSVNSKETIYKVLHNFDLKVNGVYHCRSFLGLPTYSGKAAELKKVMKERGWRKSIFQEDTPKEEGYSNFVKSGIWKYDVSKLLYIGDEATDVHACRKLGIKMLGIEGGLNSRKALLEAGLEAQYLIKHANEIPEKIDIIEKTYEMTA